MQPRDQLDQHKKVAERHFRAMGFEVHLDVPISEDLRWRPHLFVQDDFKMIMDIVDDEQIPELQLAKYVEIMNTLPKISVYICLIGGNPYPPELFSDCYKNGIGVYVIKGNALRQLSQSKPRSIETLAGGNQLAIMPSSPFGNMLSLKKCLRRFRKHLKWLELNLPKVAFEILYDSIKQGDLKDIESIQLLRGIDDKLTETFRDEFKGFRGEISSWDIDAELRVLPTRKIASTIHGRYMHSIDDQGAEIRVQLPPLNSLRGDQWDTIFTVDVIPSFDEFWTKGRDLLNDWPFIKKAVKEHLEQKVKQARILLETAA